MKNTKKPNLKPRILTILQGWLGARTTVNLKALTNEIHRVYK